ncbi:putative NAD-dependent protein deacetylase sir-2.1 [Paratrimastix pyriformis]|uniref:NAD-dependent protein deacetylase sir-2.1 n=1 Tax=Paratrimastix pyriformis TaxID=342808 RepID=A0ABQ8UUC6_9EUKA|nr:putative NAD-dependent protein deacetylase sir-2.1 [Paratrimastix pyriformis]
MKNSSTRPNPAHPAISRPPPTGARPSLASKPHPPSTSTRPAAIAAKHISPSRPPAQKISQARFDPHPVASPFQGTGGHAQGKTAFAHAYNSGSIPCRLQHGTVRITLQWNNPLPTLSYDPLLLLCMEGLQETDHPFVTVAQLATRELLTAPDAGPKVAPLVAQLALRLRASLLATSRSPDGFLATLEVLRLLSNCVGPELNPHTASFLAPLANTLLKPAAPTKLRDKCNEVLETLARNGGAPAMDAIRAKVPSFR